MEKDKFKEIYAGTIENLKNDLDPSGITKFKRFSFERIFDNYQKERNRIKTYYMQNPNENIDRHKIASSMLYAIMKVYPVYIPFNKKLSMFFSKKRFPVELCYINEYIAVYTALSILDNFYEKDKEDGKLDARRHRIYVPETFSDDHGYILNMCIDLKFGKMKRKINTLTYSNIFFLMEYQHPFNNDDTK